MRSRASAWMPGVYRRAAGRPVKLHAVALSRRFTTENRNNSSDLPALQEDACRQIRQCIFGAPKTCISVSMTRIVDRHSWHFRARSPRDPHSCPMCFPPVRSAKSAQITNQRVTACEGFDVQQQSRATPLTTMMIGLGFVSPRRRNKLPLDLEGGWAGQHGPPLIERCVRS